MTIKRMPDGVIMMVSHHVSRGRPLEDLVVMTNMRDGGYVDMTGKFPSVGPAPAGCFWWIHSVNSERLTLDIEWCQIPQERMHELFISHGDA